MRAVFVKESLPLQFAANVAGRFWAFLSNFLFVPVYLNLLGIEKFGVIALFIAVGGLVAFLDMGLSPTLARELNDERFPATRRASLLFTFEAIYLAIVTLLILFALTIPGSWFGLILSASDLARAEVSGSIRLLLVAAIGQLLLNFYVAGLIGVERQVRGNLVMITAGLVRSALVIVPLWLYPEPAVYLAWQVAAVAVFSLIARSQLYQVLKTNRPCERRQFIAHAIAENWVFTGSMFVVSLTAAINTQLDKLLVGRLAGLEALASYSLVTTFSQLLVFVVSPITLTLLPRMVRTASAGDEEVLRQLFVITHRIVAAIGCSMFGVMWFFGPYLVQVWTVGKISAKDIEHFAPALIAGYALLAVGTVPHCVAIAKKNMAGSLMISLSVFLTIPAYWLLVSRYGALGAAVTWLLLQSVVVPAYYWWVDRRLLRLPNPAGLFFTTVAMPLAACLPICWAARRFLFDGGELVWDIGIIAVAFVACTAVCLLIALRPADRGFLRNGLAT